MTTAAAPLHYSQSSSATRGSQSGLFQHSILNKCGSTELNRFGEVELPLCDFKDVTLVVLEGKCSLTERKS